MSILHDVTATIVQKLTQCFQLQPAAGVICQRCELQLFRLARSDALTDTEDAKVDPSEKCY